MIHELPEFALVIAYQIAKEKYNYLDRLDTWKESNSFFKGFKPRDPYPTLSEHDINGFLNSAARLSFPELCGYRASEERPDAVKRDLSITMHRKDEYPTMTYDVSTSNHMYHRENYAYKPGYGFMDTGYSEEGTLNDIARNRNAVINQRLSGRDALGHLMKFDFQRLDYFRTTIARQIGYTPAFERKVKVNFIKQLNALTAEEEINAARQRIESGQNSNRYKIQSIEQYLSLVSSMDKFALDIYRGYEQNNIVNRDEYEFMRRAKSFFERHNNVGDMIAQEKRKFFPFSLADNKRLYETLEKSDLAHMYVKVARYFGICDSNILSLVLSHEADGKGQKERDLISQNIKHDIEVFDKTVLIPALRKELRPVGGLHDINHNEWLKYHLTPSWKGLKTILPRVYDEVEKQSQQPEERERRQREKCAANQHKR